MARLAHHRLNWVHPTASVPLEGLFCTVFGKSAAHLHYASKSLQSDNCHFFYAEFVTCARLITSNRQTTTSYLKAPDSIVTINYTV